MRRRRSLLPLLSLLALLCLAGTARALSVEPPPLPPLSMPAAESGDEGEDDEPVDDCDEEESAEEQEECEEELLGDANPPPPEECLLRTVTARAVTYADQERARLVIRYVSSSPVEVLVDFRAKGGRGTIALGHARQHFSQGGVARLAEHLGPAQIERVRAARSIVVDLAVPSAADDCDRFYTRHLTIRHAIRHQVVWSQSDPTLGR